MNCLFKLHQALKESSYGGEARQSVSLYLKLISHLSSPRITLFRSLTPSAFALCSDLQKMAEYRKKARSLMMFAGMLRYRMSQEVYQQLTRLDAFF